MFLAMTAHGNMRCTVMGYLLSTSRYAPIKKFWIERQSMSGVISIRELKDENGRSIQRCGWKPLRDSPRMFGSKV